jgi:hypothetical protein
MIDENLTEQHPSEEYDIISSSCVFIGTKIKNKYDESRLCVQPTYGVGRYSLTSGEKLLGTTKDFLPEHKNLIKKIKQQKIYDLIGYNLILQDHGLTCNDCYFNLNPPVYPIDNVHIRKYIPDFDFEKFICFKPEVPKFQAFSSLNLFFIVQD